MFTKIMISTTALALIALISQILCSEVSLRSVCTDQAVSLDSISETRNLIKQNEQQPLEVCDSYKRSLSELDGILSVVETGHVCSLSLVNEIQNYHKKFVDTSRRDGVGLEQNRESIPKPLRLFFMALCFQISAECKINFINNLKHDTNGVISEADYAQIRLLEKYDVTVFEDQGEISDFDDILLLSDVHDAADIDQSIRETQITIKVSTNNVIRQLLGTCKNKFRPFYEQLIMPLIKLSNMGYNYEGELLERELEELKQNKDISRWFNIVQVCESLSMIKIYEEPDRVVESDGALLGVLTFIDAGTELSLRQRNLKPIDEIESEQIPYQYKPLPSHNSDVLWIKDQIELDKLIQKYRANVSMVDRIRAKLTRKMVSRVKELILSGQVKMLASELIACHRQSACETRDSSVSSDVLKLIDNAVKQDELKKGIISESDEEAVSWSSSKKERGISTRKVNKPLNKIPSLPPRVRRKPKYEDQTKLSTKGRRFFKKFGISRWSLFFWLLAIFAILVILLSATIVG